MFGVFTCQGTSHKNHKLRETPKTYIYIDKIIRSEVCTIYVCKTYVKKCKNK